MRQVGGGRKKQETGEGEREKKNLFSRLSKREGIKNLTLNLPASPGFLFPQMWKTWEKKLSFSRKIPGRVRLVRDYWLIPSGFCARGRDKIDFPPPLLLRDAGSDAVQRRKRKRWCPFHPFPNSNPRSIECTNKKSWMSGKLCREMWCRIVKKKK